MNINKIKKLKIKFIIIIFSIIIYIFTKFENVSFKSNVMSKNKDFESKINYYENYTENIKFYPHTHIYSDNIYWCWFKGLKKAPKLYQATYNSVKNNCNKHNNF